MGQSLAAAGLSAEENAADVLEQGDLSGSHGLGTGSEIAGVHAREGFGSAGSSRAHTPQPPQNEYLSTVLEATEDGTQGTNGSVSRARMGGGDSTAAGFEGDASRQGRSTRLPLGPTERSGMGLDHSEGLLRVGHHLSAVGSLPG